MNSDQATVTVFDCGVAALEWIRILGNPDSCPADVIRLQGIVDLFERTLEAYEPSGPDDNLVVLLELTLTSMQTWLANIGQWQADLMDQVQDSGTAIH